MTEYLTDEDREALRSAARAWVFSSSADDQMIATVERIVARHRAEVLRSRHCGCAWCCATTPPEQRGEMHKKTCSAGTEAS